MIDREQEKVNDSLKRLQKSEDDYLLKNEKLKAINSQKYKEVQYERKDELRA